MDAEAEIGILSERVNNIVETVARQERTLETIQTLCLQTEKLANEIKYLREGNQKIENKLTSVEAKVCEMENKPAKRFDNIVSQVITFLVGLALGCLALKLGIKM